VSRTAIRGEGKTREGIEKGACNRRLFLSGGGKRGGRKQTTHQSIQKVTEGRGASEKTGKIEECLKKNHKPKTRGRTVSNARYQVVDQGETN